MRPGCPLRVALDRQSAWSGRQRTRAFVSALHPRSDPAPAKPAGGTRTRTRIGVFRFLERFFQIEAASGIVLLCATVLALLWANSPWRLAYEDLWHFRVVIRISGLAWELTSHFVVNEALMTVFFLLVGLELRRELHHGALSSVRQAIIPVAAALGGVIVPAVIYLGLVPDGITRRGWAIPTATDIAFAIGILAILGRRVPPPARVLLLSLAVTDDVIAVLLIAVFYSAGIQWVGLLVVVAGIVLIKLLQRLGIRAAIAYLLPAAVLWVGMFRAGVHPTLSGVILGLLTPAVAPEPSGPDDSMPPVERMQIALHPWVAYGIMPLFAFANAGVSFDGVLPLEHGEGLLVAAIVLALVIGKPFGIVAGTWLARRSGVGILAPGLDWRGVMLVGILGGIGFTMSILIASLAFEGGELLPASKLGVLCGSALAAGAGLLIGRFCLLRSAQ
jgi:Na+:H+ antiporter, NhaA family